ncbi:MAG: DUF5674 family protein [Vulcanimicrobiota bacterium]
MPDDPIIIVQERINNATLRGFLDKPFPEMVKFVVDVENERIALGGELHADAEDLLLEDESTQEYLWGGNIYPDAPAEKKIEYTALINIRPSQDNRSMEIQDRGLREKIGKIVNRLIELDLPGEIS